MNNCTCISVIIYSAAWECSHTIENSSPRRVTPIQYSSPKFANRFSPSGLGGSVFSVSWWVEWQCIQCELVGWRAVYTIVVGWVAVYSVLPIVNTETRKKCQSQ